MISKPKTKDQKLKTLHSYKIYGKKILVYGMGCVCYAFLLTGCAARSSGLRALSAGNVSSSQFIDLESFCEKYGFQYELDTLDDLIRISSRDGREIKLIINSFVGSFNGRTIYFKNLPIYSKGTIYLPRELEKIVFSKETALFSPVYSIKTIVVDPGHGGRDPGAVSVGGMYEKDLNLKVSKYLKEELESKGFNVILTREQDKYLSLEERVDAAKESNADLFISVHANSNHARFIRGVEVYYLSSSRFNSQERAVNLAKKERGKFNHLSSDVKTIVWDLLLTKNYALSIEFVNNLYRTFKNLGFKVEPPKSASFFVLKSAYVPSILVEMGYLSNREEENILRRKSYQKQIAQAIALSVSSLNSSYTNLVKK